MSTGEYCNREVVIITKSESVRDAVALMRQYHVGTVVIVEVKNMTPHPLGILTDRDIVLEILAKDVDLASVSVGDVIDAELVTVNESADLLGAVELMRARGVRRLPVVNDEGGLIGILSLDDVLGQLAEEMSNIAQLISKEQRTEQTRRA